MKILRRLHDWLYPIVCMGQYRDHEFGDDYEDISEPYQPIYLYTCKRCGAKWERWLCER